MSGPQVRLLEQPEPGWERVTFDALHAFNHRMAPGLAMRDLMAVAEHAGVAIAGLFGWTYGGWLFVGRLWVHPDWRGEGVASGLMDLAEDEARARGCHGAHTDTFTFQALSFYQKRGYAEFGRLEGFDGGQVRHYLRRSLHDDIL